MWKYCCKFVGMTEFKEYLMRRLVYLAYLLTGVGVLCGAVSCQESVTDRLDRAEKLVAQRPDSAAILLSDIDCFMLDEDAKAKYIITKAQTDLLSYHTLVTDSLLPEAVSYYRENGDTTRWLKANILYIHYLIAMNRNEEGAEIINEVIATIPSDSIDRQYELRRMKMQMDMSCARYPEAIAETEWLMYHTVFPKAKFRRAYDKMGLLFLNGRKQQAIEWGDTIIASDFMATPDDPDWSEFMGDYAEMLDECGQSRRAIGIVEEILDRNPGFSPEEKAGFLASLAKYHANTGNLTRATEYLDRLDSLDFDKRMVDTNSDEYLRFLRSAIDFKATGHLSCLPDKKLKNELLLKSRISSDALAEMNTLSATRMQLTIEKKNMAIIWLSICLALVIVASVLFWMLRRRRARLLAAQERIDTLDDMLRQVKDSREDDRGAMLKKMVLQQMGILKTFASTPTPQSQEALKKISSTGSETISDKLVDWDTLYTMVDELHDGFHSRTEQRFPSLFTEKEIQIICLMKSGFSTKEISFLTEQSAATIYVRKSAIRKKLDTPEGGDIISQIESML